MPNILLTRFKLSAFYFPCTCRKNSCKLNSFLLERKQWPNFDFLFFVPLPVSSTNNSSF
uniref:Uncharacterized protein n=1 Tax=Anguilla anguilla TaxID=7936 RepID=A0A0E9WN93_ANGAN